MYVDVDVDVNVDVDVDVDEEAQTLGSSSGVNTLGLKRLGSLQEEGIHLNSAKATEEEEEEANNIYVVQGNYTSSWSMHLSMAFDRFVEAAIATVSKPSDGDSEIIPPSSPSTKRRQQQQQQKSSSSTFELLDNLYNRAMDGTYIYIYISIHIHTYIYIR